MAVELGKQTETSVVFQPNRDTKMETPVGSRSIWEEIELSESYLVCSMFKEASLSASSVLKRLCDKTCNDLSIIEDFEVNDMFESAGMVLVQSLKELGRTLEILTELTQLYGSLTTIPVQVFLAGACFLMQEDPQSAKKVVGEYLSKWKLVDEQYYVVEKLDTNTTETENRIVLEVNTYVQVVEVYITLLTGILDVAISWVEKAALPENIRQELLRRLQSSKDSGTQAQAATSANGNITSSAFLKKETGDGDDAAKQAILKYSGQQRVSTFWWFRTVNLKFGGVRFAVSNGSILLTILVVIACYFIRRKKYSITSILKAQALFVKKTAIDLWQLAFSYQVNPLAAVDSLQNPTRVNR